jgi:hypothetical protein
MGIFGSTFTERAEIGRADHKVPHLVEAKTLIEPA